MPQHRFVTPLVAVLAALSGGCSMKEIVAGSMVGMLEEVEGQYLRESSYRYGREAGAALLKLLDGVIASDPENEELLAIGARMNAQYALGFVDELGRMEDEDEAYARSLYAHAREYGLAALDDPALSEPAANNAVALREALAEYGEDDVGLLFWTGLATGGWINSKKDSVSAVADLPIAVAFMERVIELDDDFYFGGAHLFLGQYHGSRGKDLGGDPERARAEIEKAIALTGGKFLLARVFLARYYAVPTQNRDLFERLLEEVLDAPDDILPGNELATAIAKHKAEKLLFDEDDFFVDLERFLLR